MPYQINGTDAGENTSESATWQELQLSFRVTKSRLDTVFRPLEPNAEKVETLETDTGGFTVKDRSAGTDNTHTITPPSSRQPLRQAGDYHVIGYEDEQVSQDVNEFDVTLTLLRTDAKTLTTLGLTQTGNWELTVSEGTIGTNRISAELLSRGEDGVEKYELTAILTVTQAQAIEQSLARLNGYRVREIADSTNLAVDDSAGRATVDIDATPDTTVVPTGGYACESWETTRLNDAYAETSLTIAKK
jgi:hypothetical protein